MQIVRANRNTAFGMAHGFDKINSISDFQAKIPILSYDDIKEFIDAELNGKPMQLTAQSPTLFAITSGTTGASKYIPMTEQSKAAKSELMRVWLSQLFHDHPTIFDGRILTIVSPEVEEYSPAGIPCGSESGHGYRKMPGLLKSLYSCPYEVYEIKNYDAKYYALLRTSVQQNLTLLFTCNPSTVLLIAERMGDHAESLIRDIRDGTISSDFDIPDVIRAKMLKGFRPDPERAKELEQARDAGGGRLLPKHAWPNLPVICCWKGGTVGMYLEKFDHYFVPGTPVRDIGYFASEMRGSVPMTDEGPEGVLAINTNVCEFFPAELSHKPQPHELLLADQLEVGKHYFFYVTTHAGLYRYAMNDIVEVTGYYEKTPLIRFVQKGKGVVSFTGEKLYENQVINSVEKALEDRKGQFEFIAAIGEMKDNRPFYAFLVEFDSSPNEEQAKAYLARLENNLRKHNMEYASKRDSQRLAEPVLRIVALGEFNEYRKRVVAAGKNDGQFKTLRLTTDVAFANEFAVEREIQHA